MTKDEFLEHLNEAKMVLDKLSEKEKVLHSISSEWNKANKEEKRMREQSGGGMYILLLFAVILIIWTSISLFWNLSVMGKGITVSDIIKILIIAAIFLTMNFIKKSAKQKNSPIADEYHKNTVEPLIQKKQAQQKVVNDFANGPEMNYIKQFIPKEYLDSYSISRLTEFVRTGRADNEKEAYNLYEDEKYRNNIERLHKKQLDYAEQSLKEQKKQTGIQEDILRKQRTISRKVSYGNYINTKNYYENKRKKKILY